MAPERKWLLPRAVGERPLALAPRVLPHGTPVLAPDGAPRLLTDGCREDSARPGWRPLATGGHRHDAPRHAPRQSRAGCHGRSRARRRWSSPCDGGASSRCSTAWGWARSQRSSRWYRPAGGRAIQRAGSACPGRAVSTWRRGASGAARGARARLAGASSWRCPTAMIISAGPTRACARPCPSRSRPPARGRPRRGGPGRQRWRREERTLGGRGERADCIGGRRGPRRTWGKGGARMLIGQPRRAGGPARRRGGGEAGPEPPR